MAYSYPEVTKFSGLHLQANSFEVPDGAMEIAQNIVIRSDGVISKNRGFYTYYTPPTGRTIKGLFLFQNYLFALFDNGIVGRFSDDLTYGAENPLGTRTDLTGATIVPRYCPQIVKQNKNCYFTAENGIFKLEVFSGKIKPSGVPPALEVFLFSRAGVSGPLPANSQTAYRVVYGRRDVNGNLLLGAPSDVATIGVAADKTGATFASAGAGPYTITVTAAAHGLTSNQYVIFTNSIDADANGTYLITVTGTNTFTYSVSADPGATGTVDYSFTREATLVTTIPSEINDTTEEWFARVYRSTSSVTVATNPTPDYKLIAEQNLSSAVLANGVYTFVDDVDSVLVGAELYTNENSQEGENQANHRPPSASDITLFKEYMVYTDVITRQRLPLQLVDALILSTLTVTLKLGAVSENYVATTGLGNQRVLATGLAGTGTITVTYAAHGMSNGWRVYISEITGTFPEGEYTIAGVTANTFTVTYLLATATELYFEAVTNGTNPIFYCDTVSASYAQQLANTSQYLVKSINRNSALAYANYISMFDDIPGKMRYETKGFDSVNKMTIKTNAASMATNAFVPPVPNDFGSGTQVLAESDVYPDGAFVSKVGEPEAVPVANLFRAGSRTAKIQRCFSLRDSVIFIKEDGAYRMVGDSPSNFTIVPMDDTVTFPSAMGASKINNTVIAISSQGLSQITESTVQVISRNVDDVIQPIVVNTSVMETSLGFGYENDRMFYFSQSAELFGRTNETYLYNVINGSWTTTDLIFRNLAIGPSDICFGVQGSTSVLLRERKSQNLLDYTRNFRSATLTVAPGVKRSGLLILGAGSSTFTPYAGDIVTYGGLINRIVTVELESGNYRLTFSADTNVPDASVATAVKLYEGFQSKFKMAPFHAGAVGRQKQFSQFSIHLRQNTISRVLINFSGGYFGSSEDTIWTEASLTEGLSGWGYEHWALFPWGMAIGTNLVPGTASAAPIRTYVPMFAQRQTFIQPQMIHRQAAEPMFIQAMSYAVRGYGERTSR